MTGSPAQDESAGHLAIDLEAAQLPPGDQLGKVGAGHQLHASETEVGPVFGRCAGHGGGNALMLVGGQHAHPRHRQHLVGLEAQQQAPGILAVHRGDHTGTLGNAPSHRLGGITHRGGRRGRGTAHAEGAADDGQEVRRIVNACQPQLYLVSGHELPF